MSNGSDPATVNRLLAISLVTGGLVTIAVAVVLGATVSAGLYAVALIGLVDFALAWAYSNGRLGPVAAQRRQAEASGDTAATAQSDPTYNPYARED